MNAQIDLNGRGCAAKSAATARWRPFDKFLRARRRGAKPATHRIEISLSKLEQLFNSMDPSPFHERDLDRDADEFITSWAQEFPLHEPISLLIHLAHPPESEDARAMIKPAVHHYFGYRAKLNALELGRLWKDGRKSLLIGLTFLSACLLTAGLVAQTHPAWNILREGLTIAGWVAMWRPMEIYLYDWWPLRRRAQILAKMSHMDVQVRPHKARARAPTEPAALPVPGPTRVSSAALNAEESPNLARAGTVVAGPGAWALK